MLKYTERQTEDFYDHDDRVYQSFWDEEGSLHWGYFSEENKNNFKEASLCLTDLMAGKAKINSHSIVLDLGCGNGNVSIYLAKKYGCKVVGIDLSGVRIKNAVKKLTEETPALSDKVSFVKCSAIGLPFKNESFTHVFSHATLYHVHDKRRALGEIRRVLEQGGRFVFDDLVKPKENISADAKKYIYDRLLFDTEFNLKSYRAYLRKIGFEVQESEDLSGHLRKSYLLLASILDKKISLAEDKNFLEEYKRLALAYKKTAALIRAKELGWGMYVCEKTKSSINERSPRNQEQVFTKDFIPTREGN